MVGRQRHTVRRLVLSAIALAALGLADGCARRTASTTEGQPAARPASPATRAPNADPALRLRQLAAAEREARDAQRADAAASHVPPPPGVDDAALASADESTSGAWLSLADAVERIVQLQPAPPSPHAPDADADAEAPPAAADDDEAADRALRAYIRAREAAEDGRHQTAIIELQRALADQPGDAAILRALAENYRALGNVRKAIELYEQVLAVDPGDGYAAFTVGLAAANARRFDTAVAAMGPVRLRDDGFTHDPAANLLADYTLGFALHALGYDRASIDATQRALEALNPLPTATGYRQQVESLYRQRGGLWRQVGDAHCRLGDYAAALDAYRTAADLPLAEPGSLLPRVLYANLRLGRPDAAQSEFLAGLDATGLVHAERLVAIARYLAQWGGDVQPLRNALRRTLDESPNNPVLVRVASALFEPAEGRAMLTAFLDRRPDDVEVATELMRGLAEHALEHAAALAAELIERRPHQAERIGTDLICAVDRPGGLVAAIRTLPPSSQRAVLEGRTLAAWGALGDAWRVVEDAQQQGPDEVALLTLRTDLTAALNEPWLLRGAIDAARPITHPAGREHDADAAVPAAPGVVRLLLVQSRSLRALDQPDEAVMVADDAVQRRRTAATLTELAAARAAQADAASDADRRTDFARLARDAAEAALAVDPAHEDAFAVLARLHGEGGVAEDRTTYQQLAARLHREIPGSPLFERLAAMDDLRLGRVDRGLQRLRALYDADPHDAGTLAMITRVMRELERTAELNRWLREQLEQRPHDPLLLEQYITLLIETRQPAIALSMLENRVAEEPLNQLAAALLERVNRVMGYDGEAIALGEKRLRSRPAAPRRQIELAGMYGSAGRYNEALTTLRWLIEHEQALIVDEVVAAATLLERLDAADDRSVAMILDLADLAQRRWPDDVPPALLGAAVRAAAVRGVDSPAFLDALQRAVSAVPDEPDDVSGAWRDLVQSLVDAGRPAAAAAAARARLFNGPELGEIATARMASIAVTADAAGGRAADTVRLIRRLIDEGRLRRPDALGDVLYDLSGRYSILGNREGAAHLLREVITLKPHDAISRNDLGYQLIEAGDDSPATARLLEEAHALDPDDPNILDSIGWLRYRQGAFADVPAEQDGRPAEPGAETLIRRSLAADDGLPSGEVLDHLGDVLWRLGRRDAALDAWRQAVAAMEAAGDAARMQQAYRQLQQNWGLLVADPAALYDLHFRQPMQRIEAKVHAVEAGREPDIAPTFAELNERR